MSESNRTALPVENNTEAEETCATCRFWQYVANELFSHPEDFRGRCRRLPPVYLSSQVHLATVAEDEQCERENGEKLSHDEFCTLLREEAEAAYSWAQPTVRAHEWCGEYRAKPEQKAGA